MSSYDVRLWAIRKRSNRRMPYQLRWVVAGHEHSESFLTKALADAFRAELLTGARAGEPFDPMTGLPESRTRDISWFQHACDYVDMKWPRAAAKSRKSIAEAMTTVSLALLANRRGKPDDEALRAALYGWVFSPAHRSAEVPPEISATLAWLDQASVPVASLRDLPTVRRVLDALSKRMDGQPAAATTMYRKRAVFYNALGYAVERQLLPTNPIDQVQWSAPEVAETVDRRVVAGPDQVKQLLAAVRSKSAQGEHLYAFFAVLYYAGLRPSEAIALRADNCVLPETGWGRLDLTSSEPRAGQNWTDDGRARDARGLKHRSADEVRSVPIPAVLVGILQQHLATYGEGSDGRLFRSGRGGPLQETAYARVWRAARQSALTPAQASSPLARRPYDLRHACASLMLNAGVPATEVARRLGHSVAMLLKRYANCIDGQETTANERIAEALGEEAM
jgi:integrase